MARQSRLYLADTAQLVSLTGVNHSIIVQDEADAAAWLAIMRSIAPVHAVDIHAFALCPSDMYLLVRAHDAEALGRLMQDMGRRYVRHFNQRHQRTGPLWNGRYRTVYLQDAPHVLRAYVWLDGLSEDSSRACHLGQARGDFIRDHAQFWALGNTPFDRQLHYAAALAAGVSASEQAVFVQGLRTGLPIGDAVFLSAAAASTGRRVTAQPRGRPKKT